MWNLPAPPGFQGFHPDKPFRIYQRHLRHWRQEGATYFVTFRLSDSLPQAKLDERDGFQKEWERLHPPPQPSQTLEKLAREIARRVERCLDQGHGSCVLKHSHLAAHVVDAMHHFDIPIAARPVAPPVERPSLVVNQAPSVRNEQQTVGKGRPASAIVPRYELGCYVVMAIPACAGMT